jgi:putative hydrolase of the HAD superfamily
LLLFDLDDTLCDYASARSVRLSQAFRLAFDAAQIPEPARPPLDELLAESLAYHPHGADHFVDLLARYGVAAQHALDSVEWYRGNPLHSLSLFQGVHELLTMVHELPSGGRRTLGVITNGPTELQREKLRILGIEQLIDFAIISEEFGAAKPDPAIFWEALRRGNATPKTAVFVGDAPEFDILGAHRVGIPAIWMNARHLAWPKTIPPPDWEIHSLDEVVPLLGHQPTSATSDVQIRTSFPS